MEQGYIFRNKKLCQRSLANEGFIQSEFSRHNDIVEDHTVC